MEMVCLFDFAGNNKTAGYWADYDPDENFVLFGGDWYDIPDWEIDHQPTEAELLQHIAEFRNTEKLIREPYTTPLLDFDYRNEISLKAELKEPEFFTRWEK